MARTGLFGGFYFDEEVFTDMMEEAPTWRNDILASNVVQNDNSIMDAIGSSGNVATIPIYKPISIFDNDMNPLNNDGMTNNTPVETKGEKQTCMLIQRMKAFKAKDFTAELTGADPLGRIKRTIQEYYNQVWENEMMNIVTAVLGVEELKEHVTDLSVTSDTIGEKNLITATTLIDAEQAALGDMAGGSGLLVMHSKIYGAYKKLGLVEFDKYVVGNAIQQEITLPRIGGKIVKVTDRYTVDASVPNFPVYSTFLLGEGAFKSCDKKNYKNQYTTDYDPETAAGTDMFYTKQGKVLHPNGLSLAVDNIEKESPTTAELKNKANWSLKFDHKNVRMGIIKTNG